MAFIEKSSEFLNICQVKHKVHLDLVVDPFNQNVVACLLLRKHLCLSVLTQLLGTSVWI